MPIAHVANWLMITNHAGIVTSATPRGVIMTHAFRLICYCGLEYAFEMVEGRVVPIPHTHEETSA